MLVNQHVRRDGQNRGFGPATPGRRPLATARSLTLAIYHLHAKVISRSSGRSIVAASAYRSGSMLTEESTGLVHNFSKKPEVVAKGIEAPDGAPAWAKNRASLWNAVENQERRKDSQLGREIEVALPVELTLAQQKELLQNFVRKQFVSHGMVADWAIHHDNRKNPHAHVLLTMRPLEMTPSGEARFGKKETAWNAKPMLLGWREAWADHNNRSLALAGQQERIDHRSYADQQIRLVPGIKIGRGAKEAKSGTRGQRDIVVERLAAQAAIARQNGQAIAKDPTIALEALTRQQATFSVRDVRAFLRSHTADQKQLKLCMERVLAHGSVVHLGVDKNGVARLSSSEMLSAERQLLVTARAMSPGASGGAAEASQADSARSLRSVERTLGLTLTEEQRLALSHVTSKRRRLSVLEGTAGSGKSTLLSAARASFAGEGLVVRGATLSGAAAASLEASTGISSQTLASLERSWALGRTDGLGPKSVLVIDEAALVGTRQLGRVLERVRAYGGRAVLVGDSAQLPAIEAGAPMRAVGELIGSARLSVVHRQREAWQRASTEALARGEVGVALQNYEQGGRVHEHRSQAGATEAVVAQWRADQKRDPQSSQLLLTYRRVDVEALNLAARKVRAEAGELGDERLVQTERGLKTFAENDRVVFLRNDRALGGTNGSLSTLR